MPTYVAFLRAINLGAKRKFPKDAIRAATEAAGGRDVETYINTGNVRLTHSARSAKKVQQALEEAYAEAAGFEVPTIVFTGPELAALVERAVELNAEHAPEGQHYITLYADPPPKAAVESVAALDPGEGVFVVDGRAAHGMLVAGVGTSKALSSKEFKALGQGTARTLKVLQTCVEKWC